MKAEKDKIGPSRESFVPLGVTTVKNKVFILAKTSGPSKKEELAIVSGKNGLRFASGKDRVHLALKSAGRIGIDKLVFLNLSPCDNGFFLSFVSKNQNSCVMWSSVSKNLKRFSAAGKIAQGYRRGILAPNYKNEGRHCLYLNDTAIRTVFSKDLKKWKTSDIICLAPRGSFFDSAPLTLLGISLLPHGILVVYDASYKHHGNTQRVKVGAALFSLLDPDELIWRSDEPLWEELLPAGHPQLNPLGAAFINSDVLVYYASPNGQIFTVSFPQPFPSVKSQKALVNLKRFHKNPIIVPDTSSEWESEATFNPAALYDDGKVHLLYRAVGRGGISCFGYSSSEDGYHFAKSQESPAYYPRKDFEGINTKPSQYKDLYRSGGGWGGCEDPKLTAIGDKVHLTYVAYNGYSPPRIALSSISRADFKQKRWNWDEPVLISRPGEVNKSGCILPEKISGKYVIFHRVFPHILIDYRDELKFEDGQWLKAHHKIPTRRGMWDSRKLSIGATPIKTGEGWLVIYHAVDDKDPGRYKIGAMILALDDPSRVLYRTTNPILEPTEHYENEGKPGVVYPCGAVVLGQELFVYYGGGDRVVCCATAQISELLKALKKGARAGYQLKKVTLGG